MASLASALRSLFGDKSQSDTAKAVTSQLSGAEHLIKSLFVMASLVEARDPYTGGHLWRVSQFSRLLAEDLGLAPREVARIALGGFLHDLGKIGVPDAILNKPDKLTDEEYDVIKTHPSVGARLLADHPLADMVREAVLMHHETPDGRGYPLHLVGEDIPMVARIVGLTDAFDAMTSTRPYRRGMPKARAEQIVHENLGRQFDSTVGERFLVLSATGTLDHIIGHSELGIPLQDCPMCGPTIVVRRDHRAGALVYCRHCGGEAEIQNVSGAITLVPTGRRGGARDLEPDVAMPLITELVSEAHRHLEAGQQG